jgi:hypothetical protein
MKENVQVIPSPEGFVPSEYTRGKMEFVNALLQGIFQTEAVVLLVAPDASTGALVNQLAIGFDNNERVRQFIHEAAHAPDGHVEVHSYDNEPSV